MDDDPVWFGTRTSVLQVLGLLTAAGAECRGGQGEYGMHVGCCDHQFPLSRRHPAVTQACLLRTPAVSIYP
jgi:hypothetical protein